MRICLLRYIAKQAFKLKKLFDKVLQLYYLQNLPFVEDFVMRPTGERPGKGAGGTTPRATEKYFRNSKPIVVRY